MLGAGGPQVAQGGVGRCGGLAVPGDRVQVAQGGRERGVTHQTLEVGDGGALGGQQGPIGVPVGVGVGTGRLGGPQPGGGQDLPEQMIELGGGQAPPARRVTRGVVARGGATSSAWEPSSRYSSNRWRREAR